MLNPLLEYAGQHVVGIEIKATATPARRDVRHVEWLRDRLGERFIGGVLLHTGLVTTTLADRIYALPISALWA